MRGLRRILSALIVAALVLGIVIGSGVLAAAGDYFDYSNNNSGQIIGANNVITYNYTDATAAIIPTINVTVSDEALKKAIRPDAELDPEAQPVIHTVTITPPTALGNPITMPLTSEVQVIPFTINGKNLATLWAEGAAILAAQSPPITNPTMITIQVYVDCSLNPKQDPNRESFTVALTREAKVPALTTRDTGNTSGSTISVKAANLAAKTQEIVITPASNPSGAQCSATFNLVSLSSSGTSTALSGATAAVTSSLLPNESFTISGSVATLMYVPSASSRTITATITADGVSTTLTFQIGGVTTAAVTDAIPGLVYVSTSDTSYGTSGRIDYTNKRQIFTLSSYNVSSAQWVNLTFTLASFNSSGTKLADLNGAAVVNGSPSLINTYLQTGATGVADTLTVTYNPQLLKDQTAQLTITAGGVSTTVVFGTSTALSTSGNTGTSSTYTWYYVNMDIPSVMYTNEVYTFKPVFTTSATSGTTSTGEIINPYYDGEYYIIHGTATSSAYYPYSNNYKKVWYNNAWVDPLAGATPVTAAGLNGAMPAVTWASIYKIQSSSSSTSGTVALTPTFKTTAVESNATLTVQGASALFLAKRPGTYYLTVSVPAGYALYNGDSTTPLYTYNNTTGQIIPIPTTSRTFYLTFIDKTSSSGTSGSGTSSGSSTDDDIVIVDDDTPSASGGQVGRPLKSGITVSDAGGKAIGTLGLETVTILDILANTYKISYSGGVGYVPKALIDRTDAASGSSSGSLYGLNIKRWISLRSSASSNSSRVRKLLAGEQVSVIDVVNGWAHVLASGDAGYIPVKYVAY